METKTLKEKMFEIQNLNLKYHRTAKGFNYKYLPLDELWKVLQPELEKRKLLISHEVASKEVTTVVVDIEGKETITSSIPLPDDTNPQKLGSAITYFKRYNLGMLFNIITDEDDDAQSAVSTISKPVKMTPDRQKPEVDDELGF